MIYDNDFIYQEMTEKTNTIVMNTCLGFISIKHLMELFFMFDL